MRIHWPDSWFSENQNRTILSNADICVFNHFVAIASCGLDLALLLLLPFIVKTGVRDSLLLMFFRLSSDPRSSVSGKGFTPKM